jgi:hypothetical protein
MRIEKKSVFAGSTAYIGWATARAHQPNTHRDGGSTIS